jgi:hypothetical protein
MRFNLSNKFEIEKYNAYSEKLKKKGCIVDLTEKQKKRTLDQNALFHVWVAVFADFIGEASRTDCKRDIKRHLLGMREVTNCITGEVEKDDYETSKMTVGELSGFMDKFKAWAGVEGCYLPYWKDAGYEEMMEQYKNI